MRFADALTMSVPQPLILIDEASAIVDLNPAAEVMLGTSRKHVAGIAIDAILKSTNPIVDASLKDGGRAVTVRQADISVRNKRAEIFDFSAFPLGGKGEGKRAVMLSPQPHGSQLLALADGVQDKAAAGAVEVLGHEIKNPLAAIAGAAQLLGRRVEDDQRGMIDLISSEVKRIVELLNKMSTGGMGQPVQCARENVHVLIDETRQAVEAAEIGKLKIAYDYDPSIPDVWVDRAGLIQVLTNLLSNAVEAVPDDRKADIRVTTRYSFGGIYSASQFGRALRLPVEVIVSDNGDGVPADIVDDIFSPFVTSKRTGQGLGLVVVRNLLGEMGGRISHERDEIAERTYFTVHLPLASEASQ